MRFTDLVPWRREVKSGPSRQEVTYPVRSLHREIDRVFDSFFRGFDLAPSSMWGGGSGGYEPSVDIREDEDKFVITAEVPGVDEKDINISLTEDSITLRGEKKSEIKKENGEYYYHERSHGAFERTFPLSVEIDKDKVKASLKKGVLEVTLPKSEKGRRYVKKIPVSVD